MGGLVVGVEHVVVLGDVCLYNHVVLALCEVGVHFWVFVVVHCHYRSYVLFGYDGT